MQFRREISFPFSELKNRHDPYAHIQYILYLYKLFIYIYIYIFIYDDAYVYTYTVYECNTMDVHGDLAGIEGIYQPRNVFKSRAREGNRSKK